MHKFKKHKRNPDNAERVKHLNNLLKYINWVLRIYIKYRVFIITWHKSLHDEIVTIGKHAPRPKYGNLKDTTGDAWLNSMRAYHKPNSQTPGLTTSSRVGAPAGGRGSKLPKVSSWLEKKGMEIVQERLQD